MFYIYLTKSAPTHADERRESMKYRKRPVVIEAEQWFNPHRILREKGEVRLSNIDIYVDPDSTTGFSIDTLEGKHEVSDGDWIITGIKGEKYPCKPDIFELTYEKVED